MAKLSLKSLKKINLFLSMPAMYMKRMDGPILVYHHECDILPIFVIDIDIMTSR